MQDFSEHHYPRAVSGKSYRIPLDDVRLEPFARRMDLIYRGDISEEKREELLRQYKHLMWLSRNKLLDIVLSAEWLGHEPDPRPEAPQCQPPTCTWGDVVEYRIPHIRAWLRRLVVWLDRMEGHPEPTPMPFPEHGVRPAERPLPFPFNYLCSGTDADAVSEHDAVRKPDF